MAGREGGSNADAHASTGIDLRQQEPLVEIYFSALRTRHVDRDVCESRYVLDRLRALGWSEGEDLTYRLAWGAPHDEAAWGARLPALLREWFPGP